MHLKWNRHFLIFLGVGVFLFFLFCGFTLLVREDLLLSFDFDTTHRLQNLTPLRVDGFFSFLSVIGRFEYTVGLLILILVLRRKIWGIIIFGLFGFAHVIELIGKTILNHPGPPNMFLRSHYSDFPGLHVHTDASYPSGHSLRSIFLGIILIYLIWISRKAPMVVKLGIIIAVAGIVTLMLYSRVTLGEHWSTDVIGGTLLGAAIAFISLAIL